MATRVVSLCVALLLPVPAWAGFELIGQSRTAAVLVPEGESGCVRLAAEDLASDAEKITGRALPIVSRPDECPGARVLVGTVGNAQSAELLEQLVPGLVAELSGKWEAYRVRTVVGEGATPTLAIAGSDERGTMFGLYAFIEQYLGVDPFYFWGDRPPEKRDRLAWDDVRLAADEPTFKYRGWFINDEDLLSEWHLDGGERRIDYPYYAIMNVSNVRELVLGIDAAARFLRDFDRFDPERYFDAWCAERFGPAADDARRCYERLFASYVAGCEERSRNQLDGEIVHSGRRLYERLLEKLGAGARPFDTPSRVEALLTQVRRQRIAVGAAGEGIEGVRSRLDGADRAFFESNFVAQHAILLGLLRWCEHGLEAGLSLQNGDRPKMLAHIRSAEQAMRQIRAGQALASRGKWEHWYRGDRKMNLVLAEELTEKLIAAASKR